MRSRVLRRSFVLSLFLLSACGYDPVSLARKSAESAEGDETRDCYQSYNEVAYLENHTGQALNITMSYPDYSDYRARFGTVAVQLAPGGSWTRVLMKFQEYKYDGACTATPEKKPVNLATLDGTSTVRVCKVKTGVAYLQLPSTPCPSYTSE